MLTKIAMEFFCRHCEKMVAGQPYRVISEEDGIILLDMTVCASCDEQARALGLYSEPISSEEPQQRRRSEYRATLSFRGLSAR